MAFKLNGEERKTMAVEIKFDANKYPTRAGMVQRVDAGRREVTYVCPAENIEDDQRTATEATSVELTQHGVYELRLRSALGNVRAVRLMNSGEPVTLREIPLTGMFGLSAVAYEMPIDHFARNNNSRYVIDNLTGLLVPRIKGESDREYKTRLFTFGVDPREKVIIGKFLKERTRRMLGNPLILHDPAAEVFPY